jgi:hypothetical protein
VDACRSRDHAEAGARLGCAFASRAVEAFLDARYEGVRVGCEVQIHLAHRPLDLALRVLVLSEFRLLRGIFVFDDNDPWVLEQSRSS